MVVCPHAVIFLNKNQEHVKGERVYHKIPIILWREILEVESIMKQ